MGNLYTKAVIEKATDADFMAVASTAVEDRHGEIVSVEGWDLKAFKKNPVLLWGHDHSEIAVGIATKTWIEGTGKRAKLMIEGTIHEATEKARALKQLVKDGVIKTMSVGFRPLEVDGDTFEKQELLEVSFVNVPANQQAMITAYKSLKDNGFKTKTITDLGIPAELLDKLNTIEKKVTDLEEWAKVQQPSTASVGRATNLQRDRIAMNKVIAKAADNLLAGRNTLSQAKKVQLVKIIKRANENIIVSQKEQING